MHLDKHREHGIYKVTLVGSIVNFVLLSFKFTAGIVAGSAAMLADASHSLSDFITDIVVFVFVSRSGKPSDRKYNYGHGKYETLATLIIGILLLSVGGGIVWHAGEEILGAIRGEAIESPGKLALVAALVAIVCKEGLYRFMIVRGRRLRSDVVVANAWHHRIDALSSIGTALGIAGAIFLGDKWAVLDPIAALCVSFFVLRTAFRLVRSSIGELMERSLPDEVCREIEQIAASFEGVSHIHDLHTRKIGNGCAIEFHIRMAGGTPLDEAHRRTVEIEERLKEHFGDNTHAVVRVEPLDVPCKG